MNEFQQIIRTYWYYLSAKKSKLFPGRVPKPLFLTPKWSKMIYFDNNRAEKLPNYYKL